MVVPSFQLGRNAPARAWFPHSARWKN